MKHLANKFLLVTLMAVVALLLVGAASAAAPTVFVDDDGTECPSPDYTDIQTAIDSEPDGTTIIVCPGTYDGPVSIHGRSGLSLIGQGDPLVQLVADTHDYGVFDIADSTNILVQGFDIKGNDHFVFPGTGGGGIFGIGMWNSTTTILDNEVYDIVLSSTDGDTDPDDVFGAGIFADGENGDGVYDKVMIDGNTVTNFQEAGIAVRQETSAKITGNTITGSAPGGLDDWENGIGVWAGANKAQVSGNEIADINGNGIDLGEVMGAKIIGNHVDGAQTGIAVGTRCEDFGFADKHKIVGNVLEGIEENGIGVWPNTDGVSGCDPHANGNKIQGNTMTAAPGAGWTVGVLIRPNDDDGAGGFTPTADGNQVKSNTFNDFSTFVEDAGTHTKTGGNTGTVLVPSP